jgi:hypothetical protein
VTQSEKLPFCSHLRKRSAVARGAHENDHKKDVDGTYLSKLSVVMKLLDERQTSSAPSSDVVSTELGELAPP